MNRVLKTFSLLAFFVFLSSSCFLPYIAKQGYYQAKLLKQSKPISQLLTQDNLLNKKQKDQLKLILKITQFANDELFLSTSSNYSTANLEWQHTIYNVSACDPIQFKPYTWWFPIVGTVPYKGYFDIEDAKQERARLLKKGLDVYIGKTTAYSSLGYFSDPVLPNMLDLPVVYLAELIIHELAHATIYFKNKTDFNESFANVVGKLGALAFLKREYGEENLAYKEAILLYKDEELYQKSLNKLYRELDAIYRNSKPTFEKLNLKQNSVENFLKMYKQLPFSTSHYQKIKFENLNNAFLMSFKIYNTDQKRFEALLKNSKNNWKVFIDKIRSLKNTLDPFSALP